MEEKTDSAGVGVDEQTYSVPGLEGGVTKNGDRLMPEAQRESDTKTNVNPMSSEFGYYGELDAVDSGIDPTADPRNYVFDDDEYFSDGPRRRGQTLEQQERADGLNAELQAQHESNLQETDIPGGRRVWQPKERESRESDIRHAIVEEHSQTDGLVSSRALEVEPRTLVSSSDLGEINEFAARLADELDYPRHVIAKRIAWKVAPPLDIEDGETVPMSVPADDGEGEQTIQVAKGGDPLPLKFNDRPKDPFSNSISAFDAAINVQDELLYELPRTVEGVKPWHESCSIKARVTKLWNPNSASMRQAGMLEDSEGNKVKFVVWTRSDAEMYGRGDFGLGVTAYTYHNSLPMLSEGDLIEIHRGSPSKYRDIISIAVTQKTDIHVIEEGEGPMRTRHTTDYANSGGQNVEYWSHTKKVTDDHSDGVPTLAQKRYRPQWEVMARHGDFDKTDPENQPPSHPGKRRGVTDKGWNFCETWTFPVSSWTPEWFLARADVEVHSDDRPFRVRAEADVPPVGEGGSDYERFTQAEFLEVFAQIQEETNVEFSVADYVSAEMVLTGDVPGGTVEVYTSIVGGYAAPCGEDSIAIVLRPDGDEGPKARRLYRVEGWEGRLRSAVKQMILEGSSQ